MGKRYERRKCLTQPKITPRPPDPALVLAVAAVPLLAARLLVPAPAALPVIGMVSIGGVAVAALLARCLRSERHSERLSLWDVSGACALN
jgi:hypothetical protein